MPYLRGSPKSCRRPQRTGRCSPRSEHRLKKTFSEVVAGLQNAADEVAAQRDFIGTLEQTVGNRPMIRKAWRVWRVRYMATPTGCV